MERSPWTPGARRKARWLTAFVLLVSLLAWLSAVQWDMRDPGSPIVAARSSAPASQPAERAPDPSVAGDPEPRVFQGVRADTPDEQVAPADDQEPPAPDELEGDRVPLDQPIPVDSSE